jgi:hypothetical protein
LLGGRLFGHRLGGLIHLTISRIDDEPVGPERYRDFMCVRANSDRSCGWEQTTDSGLKGTWPIRFGRLVEESSNPLSRPRSCYAWSTRVTNQ